MPDCYLKISVITTCFNAENYIEQTINSVLNQKYPNLEYIMVDGGSHDKTVDIISKYQNDLSIFICEPDDGLYFGINKGLSIATGDVVAWLNADDIYMPWTFSTVNSIFKKFSDVSWITGIPSYMTKEGQVYKVASNPATAYPRRFVEKGLFRYPIGGYIQQESLFWRKSLLDKVGVLNTDHELVADYDYWIRFSKHAELVTISSVLAAFRRRPNEQKSSIGSKYHIDGEALGSALSPTPKLWMFIANKGLILRLICRLLIWRRVPIVFYSMRKGEWQKKRVLRSISRTSLQELLLEYQFLK